MLSKSSFVSNHLGDIAYHCVGSESNDVRSVRLDDHKSDAEYTQMLWDLTSC
jgi:hypothetical protein